MALLAFGLIGFVLLYQRRVIRHHLELKILREQRQQDLLQASIRAGESERRRIAEELHDDVGATLASVRLFLRQENAPDGTAASHAHNAQGIERAKAFLDDAIAKVRSLSHQLQPSLLHRLGLNAALKAFADGLSGNGHLAISYLPHAPLPTLPPDTELAIYRVVQELAANVIRHSKASLLRIETSGAAGGWHITLVHDGQGLTQQSFEEKLFAPHTTGLKNIVNRTRLVGASIHYSRDAEGTFRTRIGRGEKD